MMLLTQKLPQAEYLFFGQQLYNEDVITLLFRLTVNVVVLTILIRFLYYTKARRKDNLFTYYAIGMITFFLCFGLKKLNIDTGMGLSLFAIFGILRYRTEGIEIKEMTYLFLVIGLSVINSLASKQISIMEMSIINGVILLTVFGLENLWLLRHETRKIITYERIDLIKPEKHQEMLADLQERTGLKITRVEVGKIDFLRDTAQLRVFYYGEEQSFGTQASEIASDDD
jgi:Domain of unknown function (DUF4956)